MSQGPYSTGADAPGASPRRATLCGLRGLCEGLGEALSYGPLVSMCRILGPGWGGPWYRPRIWILGLIIGKIGENPWGLQSSSTWLASEDGLVLGAPSQTF